MPFRSTTNVLIQAGRTSRISVVIRPSAAVFSQNRSCQSSSGSASGTGRRADTRSGAIVAAFGLATAGAVHLSEGCPVQLEESPVYVPPPRYPGRFSEISKRPPTDEAGQLAWAVKHLEVERLRKSLETWPEGAALIDLDDNTLFHLAASEPKSAAQGTRVTQVVQLLLQKHGWSVVDQKNCHGERAELVADHLDPQGPASKLLHNRSRTFSEKNRIEAPLRLIGELSPKPWEWDYPVQDEQRRSFAGVNYKAFPADQCNRWMKALLEKGTWSGIPGIPRRVGWYVSEEFADCPYRYSGLEYPATVFPDFMLEIREELCKLCGIPEDDYPNSCNVNVYEDNRGEVGWHSDDEVMFQGLAGDTRILSLSLGAARDFCWRLQGTTETLGSCSLGNGDIMTMEGLFQKHFKHAVPESSIPAGKRINMTFRWIRVKAHAADAGTRAVA